jgi:hypothetical protein
MSFIVYAHCEEITEVWGVYTTKKRAIEVGHEAMQSHVSKGGGVRWVEVFGPGIEESIGIEMNADGKVEVFES